VRESAGLRPGSELEIEYRDGRVEIEPVRKNVKLVRRSGVLVAVPPPGSPKVTVDQVNRMIRDLRERRLKL
jgi:bifunctional DNA-binding transcriptional regulator/antitoxin component of YhaV-PrlF toxin-antitoxin module